MKWYQHHANCSDDPFITELEDIFGLDGYARYHKLLEVVCREVDPKNDRWSASHPWSKWQTFLKGKRNKLETFLVHLENKRQINRKQVGNILEIEIPKLRVLKDNTTRNLQASANLLDPIIKKKNKSISSTNVLLVDNGVADNCPHLKIIDLYHQILPELRRIRSWNATRQGFLRSRWREVGLDGLKMDSLGAWEKFFKYVHQSPFLIGLVDRSGSKTFQADLEWLVRPNNFQKVIEGKYHG